ncbi:hypothetical protein [Nocardioides rubriscoriae]|uniref:hypothetical protein n=1 Tax=Nocardioides rubriscoriae TaxID=642762 RepID=UPI0011E01510|nr:hypothetical protein [Nocardioides rubriscoriae]
MKVRVLVAVLLALAVGAAGGWALAASRPDPEPGHPVAFSDPAPVPAQSPSLPVQVTEPDPDDPPLAPGLALETRTLQAPPVDGRPSPLRVTLPVPVGWVGGAVAMPDPDDPVRFQFRVPLNDTNSYGLRVDLFTGPPITVERAVGARQAAMRSADTEGNFQDLGFAEEQDDGFLADYILDGYRRYSLERFFSGPDPDVAYVTVAVVGRQQDLQGMEYLVDRISEGLRPG